MSTATRTRPTETGLDLPRVGAVVGVALLTLGYLSTLYWVAGTVGNRRPLLLAAGVAAIVGVLVHSQSERRVVAAGAALALLGLGWYATQSLPESGLGVVTSALRDSVAMLSGISVRQMAGVETWVVAVVPAPVFLSTYLALRRRYVLATAAGGWLALFLALTGDAIGLETLVATVGATIAIGFGELDRREASIAGADVLVVTIAVMAVLGLFVPLVPSGEGATLSPSGGIGAGSGDSGGDAAASPLDQAVLADGSATPDGPVELSTDVRFVVRADEQRNWRTDVLGYYDGDGWYGSYSEGRSARGLVGPVGESRTVTQEVELHTSTNGPLPHAAYPVEIDGVDTAALQIGGVVPRTDGPLSEGSTYTVRSEVPDADPATLRAAGDDYPEAVERQYLQLPDDLPPRVANLTEQVTADATDDYERAVAVEAYLEDSKDYSLNVSAPEGDMVDGFLFEMEAGYCTYFASSMATMLRTQGVPARVAVGYNGGQWVDDGTYVVRGTDAHAWVEVYFPDVGWVEFDPTPGGDWEQTHGDAVESARESGDPDVDVDASENESVRYEPPESDGGSDPEGGQPGGDPGSDPGEGEVDPEQRPGVEPENGSEQPYADPAAQLEDQLPDNASTVERADAGATRLLGGLEDVLLAGLLLAGAVVGARRARVAPRLRRSVGLLWQRRVDPATDVQRAVDRLEGLLERRYEPRRHGETPREYVDRLPSSVDDRVLRAYELHERARYAGHVDEALADELVGIVDDLVRESTPIVRRFHG